MYLCVVLSFTCAHLSRLLFRFLWEKKTVAALLTYIQAPDGLCMYPLCLPPSSACSHTLWWWGGILWFSKSKASPPVHIIDAAGGAVEDAGAQGRVGVGRAGRSVGGRAGRAGAADYSGNCQLQCLQSGSNRFRVGEEEVTVDFCQASLCLCVSRLSGMTFARATVEMSHHLILYLIIHLPARALCRSVDVAVLLAF